MLQHVTVKLWDRCRSDPWFVIKFAFITAVLGIIGKMMLIGTVETTETPKWAAQFAPTVPMMGLNFLAHKHLWDHKEAKLLSHVGGQWSQSYWGQFVAGHTAFTLFAVWFGWYYIAVSLAVGGISAVVTFSLNELKIFAERRRELKTE